MRRAVAVVAGVVLTAACGNDTTSAAPPTPSPTPATSQAAYAAYASALSTPREDSVYPKVGDPSVDALHYALDLTWDAAHERLTGHETLVFRSTRTADHVQLDLEKKLHVGTLTVDGAPATFEQRGKDLVVHGRFTADRRYTVTLDYAGTPVPYPAPTTRDDIPALGFTIDAQHQAWTMQEPYGAFTWYAVNDQPSDKALYDYSLHVAAPWTGIAGGTMTGDDVADGVRTTTFHLDEPAASYLTTLAFGAYTRSTATGPGGTPISYWIPTAHPSLRKGPATAPKALRFLERYLGPYPFSTAGVLVVHSDSGMETQSLVTLGDSPYALSDEVVLHELAHQWYGDEVTPNDWRDVWMSEGMAMYLQLMYQAQQAHLPMRSYLRGYVGLEKQARAESGPPAHYDRAHFGDNNIYFGPAFMWQRLRERIGDRRFFGLVRSWPRHAAETSTGRNAYLAYVEHHTGLHLRHFWNAWLLGRHTPS